MVEFNKLKIKENCVERCHLWMNFVEAYAYLCDSLSLRVILILIININLLKQAIILAKRSMPLAL